jgi:hypothetical protein
MRSVTLRIGTTAAAAALITLTIATASYAATQPAFSIELPKGEACADFGLRIDGSGGNQVQREFTDGRQLSAGTGSALTFTNLVTGATYQTSSNGAVTQVRPNPDGSSTYTTTGHNVLILSPTDITAGPSTTLYVGRVVFTVDAANRFEVTSISGRSVDICSALAR